MPNTRNAALFTLLFLLFAVSVKSQIIQPKNIDGEIPPDAAVSKSDDSDSAKEKISYKLPRGKREIELVPAFAPMQPTFLSGFKEYNTDGRSLGMFSLRFTKTIGSKKNITYQYYFEVTPLAVAFNNEIRNGKFISDAETPNEPRTVRRTTYGAGFQPINFRFIFKKNNRIKPFLNVGAGMIFFNHKMPVPEATFYNFTGDFGGGLYITTDRERQKRAVILGYRYFHISNFNLTEFNPGYNANIFYLGYSFSR